MRNGRFVAAVGWSSVSWIACAIMGCSAVIAPDTNELNPDTGLTMDGQVVRLDAGPGVDAVVVSEIDAFVAPGTDAWVDPTDDAAIMPGDDAAVVPDDAFVTPTPDAFVAPDTGPGCAGDECTGYDTVLAMSPTTAAGSSAGAALANCVIQMHQLDCCGARAAYGINHGARSTLCSAERTCDTQYPTPAPCSDPTITTDTGETTTNPNNVRIRAVDPQPCAFGTCYTCETFVCTSDPCRTAPGISGGCGGP